MLKIINDNLWKLPYHPATQYLLYLYCDCTMLFLRNFVKFSECALVECPAFYEQTKKNILRLLKSCKEVFL